MQARSLRIYKIRQLKAKQLNISWLDFSGAVGSLCTSLWKSQHEVLSSIDLIDPLLRPHGKRIYVVVLNQETGTRNYTSSRSKS